MLEVEVVAVVAVVVVAVVVVTVTVVVVVVVVQPEHSVGHVKGTNMLVLQLALATIRQRGFVSGRHGCGVLVMDEVTVTDVAVVVSAAEVVVVSVVVSVAVVAVTVVVDVVVQKPQRNGQNSFASFSDMSEHCRARK